MLVVLVAMFIVVFDTANINIFVWLTLFWLGFFMDVKWLMEVCIPLDGNFPLSGNLVFIFFTSL